MDGLYEFLLSVQRTGVFTGTRQLALGLMEPKVGNMAPLQDNV